MNEYIAFDHRLDDHVPRLSRGYVPGLRPCLSYLAKRDGNAAAAQFRKVIEHRRIVLADPVGGLARLQLGRAYTMAGDAAKAKAAQELLS
jgi:hypothetical protein